MGSGGAGEHAVHGVGGQDRARVGHQQQALRPGGCWGTRCCWPRVRLSWHTVEVALGGCCLRFEVSTETGEHMLRRPALAAALTGAGGPHAAGAVAGGGGGQALQRQLRLHHPRVVAGQPAAREDADRPHRRGAHAGGGRQQALQRQLRRHRQGGWSCRGAVGGVALRAGPCPQCAGERLWVVEQRRFTSISQRLDSGAVRKFQSSSAGPLAHYNPCRCGTSRPWSASPR